MAVKVLCPNPDCGASFSVDPARFGRRARCTRCGTRFVLGEEGQAGRGETFFGLLAPEPGRSPAAPELQDFGRYRVVRRLGHGGMGVVYLAHDPELDRPVAIKIPHAELQTDPEVVERFRREARAAAAFHHPNFCPIYDVGQVDGTHYLTMAYLEGETLESWIRQGGPLPLRQAADVARQLARALAEAHERGIVHRDLKPANVMVDATGRLVIMDFGLVRRSGTGDVTLTQAGALLGTPYYMSPEQVRGETQSVGPAADIYALGVILYELLAGRRPFRGPAALVLGLIAVQEPKPPSRHRPGLDPALEAICRKAMAKRIEDRYPTMAAFAAELDAFLTRYSAFPGPAEAAVRPEKRTPAPSRVVAGARRPARLARWAAVGLLVLFLGLIGGLSYVITDQGSFQIDGLDPEAEVHVDGTLLALKAGEPTPLRSGEHSLLVSRGSELLKFPRSFTIRRGRPTVIPAPPRPVAR